MLDDLKYLELSDKFHNQLIEEIGYDMALNIACNYKLVKQNMESLKRFGIINLEPLLLNRIDLFLMDNDKLIKRFSKYNIPMVAKLIDDDYTFIDELV